MTVLIYASIVVVSVALGYLLGVSLTCRTWHREMEIINVRLRAIKTKIKPVDNHKKSKYLPRERSSFTPHKN